MIVFPHKYVIMLIITFFISLFGKNKAIAQLPEKSTTFTEQAIEDLVQVKDADLDFNELTEYLVYYSQHPLNLNTATEEQLRQLPFLNDLQINNLIIYKNLYGNLLSIYELLCTEGYDKRTIQNIMPYTFAGNTMKKENLFELSPEKFSQQLDFLYQRVLEKQNGYKSSEDSVNKDSKYLGNPNKICIRYYLSVNKYIKAGFIAEKDAGEEIFKGSQVNGFDFYSGVVSIEKKGFLKRMVIGDYQIQAGQGLILGSGFSFGKSPEVFQTKKISRGIYPNSSANECNFFRGLATSFSFGKSEITGFISYRKLDANILKNTITEDGNFTSLIETGYHRNNNELKDKNSLRETLYGGRWVLNGKFYRIGTTMYSSFYDKSPNNQKRPYQYFESTSKQRFYSGFDYDIMYQNINTFGEISINQNGTVAGIAGLMAAFSDKLCISTIYRNYPAGYKNPHSNAFAENSFATNEKGLFTGMQINLLPEWTFYGYVDFFTFPWLKYTVNTPSYGNEYLARIACNPYGNWSAYLQYRNKKSFLNETSSSEFITPTQSIQRSSLRLYFQLSPLPTLTIKNRIEYLCFQNSGKNTPEGFAIYPSIIYEHPSKNWTFCTGYGIFDTESYNERIYIYENDVPHSFSVPAFYDRGSRFYVLTQYALSKKVKFWIKYARSAFVNTSTLGSGEESIACPHKSEIKVLVQIHF